MTWNIWKFSKVPYCYSRNLKKKKKKKKKKGKRKNVLSQNAPTSHSIPLGLVAPIHPSTAPKYWKLKKYEYEKEITKIIALLIIKKKSWPLFYFSFFFQRKVILVIIIIYSSTYQLFNKFHFFFPHRRGSSPLSRSPFCVL